jgi:hypothetical protein
MAPKTKKKDSQTKKESSQPEKKEPPPNWPALQPLVPPSDLSLETLVEDQIVLIRNLWTSKLCKDYVAFLSSLPLMTTPGKPKRGEAVRVNDRFQIDDPLFAERMWSGTALKELVLGCEDGKRLWGGDVLGLNPNIRIYRYRPGQFFAQHCR